MTASSLLLWASAMLKLHLGFVLGKSIFVRLEFDDVAGEGGLGVIELGLQLSSAR